MKRSAQNYSYILWLCARCTVPGTVESSCEKSERKICVCGVAEICSENEIFGNRRREKVLILKKCLVSFDSQEVSCWISRFWCAPRGALFLLRDGGANLRHSSLAERKVRE